MIHSLWSRKGAILLVVLLAMGCAAALFSAGLASPEPVSSGALGPEWQCSRLALVFTTCTRIKRVQTASVGARDNGTCLRRERWVQAQ